MIDRLTNDVDGFIGFRRLDKKHMGSFIIEEMYLAEIFVVVQKLTYCSDW